MSHAWHRDWRQGDKRGVGRASGPSPGKVGSCFVWTPAAAYCVSEDRFLGRAPSTAQHLYRPARGIFMFLCVFTYTHGFWFLFLLLKIHAVSQFCFLM